VPGHYLIANGGVDTLRSLNEAYEMAERHHEQDMDVLLEGKCVSDGAARLIALRERGADARAVLLSTSLEECVASVRARGHRIVEMTIRRTRDKCLRDLERMRAAGVETRVASRAGALSLIGEWLGLRR
jgi:hypothetical protein